MTREEERIWRKNKKQEGIKMIKLCNQCLTQGRYIEITDCEIHDEVSK